VSGRTLGEKHAVRSLPEAGCCAPAGQPDLSQRRHRVLRGNLMPGARVIVKHSSATLRCCCGTRRAVVPDSLADLAARVDAPDRRRGRRLVLRNAGPERRAGMPEAGYPPIPKETGRARRRR
ncbi:MAG: dihydroxy-acid dehydratase, partial [Betaproteobacteria bacterium]|nr:dihydroxy-acid dehydratase [Betaproteobacteria bacterium]